VVPDGRWLENALLIRRIEDCSVRTCKEPARAACGALSMPSEGPARGTAKKDLKKYKFEAVMYMKTNKSRTECPIKIRTFMS
jgi:hypothetical protein